MTTTELTALPLVAGGMAGGRGTSVRSRGSGGSASVAATPASGVGGALREVHLAIDLVDGSAVDPSVAGAVLVDLDRAITRLQSERLKVLAVADRAGVAEQAGASSTSAWAAARTRTPGAAAATDIRLARALDQGLPLTNVGLASGAISTTHAAVIAQALTVLPDGMSDAEHAAIEGRLVEQAKVLDPQRLRRVARRALAAAGRISDEVDAAEDAALRTEEDRAVARSRLTLHDNLDGTMSGHFTVPTFAGEILRKTIQQIASPRRLRDRARRAGTAPDLGIDWAARYGQALIEILEHLPTDSLSSKVAATVVVTVDHERLRAGAGVGRLDTGAVISLAQVRRAACAAGLLPAVLDGESQVLDLGRTKRFFTEAQRVALATRYTECAAVGCDRPYAWSELHHEDPWARGGATDLERAVPLCGFHHRRAHDPRYEHRIRRDERRRKIMTLHRRQ